MKIVVVLKKRRKHPKPKLGLVVGPFTRQNVAEKKGVVMLLKITDIDQFAFAVDPASIVDAKGNPTKLDGFVTFTSSDPTILEVVDNGDNTGTAKAVGPLGTAQLQASADARQGPDVKTITGTVDVEIGASEAAAITITPGAVEPQ